VFHSFGLTVGLILPLVHGVRVYMYPSPLHYRIVPEMIYGTNATILFGTDTFLAGYARSANEYDFRSLRYILSGAEAVKESTRRIYMEKFGIRILEGYGVTEAGPVMFAGHPDGLPRPATSIGYPLPGCEIRLDPGPDEGVLLTRNPGVMAAYHNLPEETARRLKDGWFDTSDVCRRDADGFYYFVGRTDDMFVCGGENVYPGDVEGTLERHPDVLQAAVLPVDHELKGQVPVAFVVARPASGLTEQAVKEWALAHGPAYQHPRRVFLVPELPLAGTNKIDRAALRARAQKGE